jgi:predicted Zn-dependent protease
MLISEKSEFSIGSKTDKKIREEMGVYLELPSLRSLVQIVGKKLGQHSDRPKLVYRIEIIDSPDFNAFSVPGGFVYVHRGLLERINSVDELAAVLGHEIAHVAARHSAAQLSKYRLMNIGLLGLSVVAGGFIQDYGQFVNLGTALAFNKFSRDDERQADYFGIKYMTLAGYNPKASISVMSQIRRLQTREPTIMEGWFMTHPHPTERIFNIKQAIEKLRDSNPEALNRLIRRNEYIALLKGLAVGEWNGTELIRGDRYYNKEYMLRIDIPEAWYARLRSKSYTAVFHRPDKKFYAFLDIEPLRIKKSSLTYFNDLAMSLERLGFAMTPGPDPTQKLPHGAVRGVFKGHNRQGEGVMMETIVFVKDDNGFSMTCSSKETDFKSLRTVFERMFNSLRFITEKEALELSPPRVRIHKVSKGDTWLKIARAYYKTSSGVKKIAEYNGLDVSNNPVPGTLLKIPPALRFK